MAIPQNKTQLLEAIDTCYGKLRKDLRTVPNNLVLKKTLEGHKKGTMMSVHNLVAYLVGWGELVLKWNDKSEKGEEIDFPETGYKWNELGDLAQKFYADYESIEYKELLELLDETVIKINTLIETHTNETLYGVNWFDKYPFGRMIQLNTSSPYKNARARVRKWKKANNL